MFGILKEFKLFVEKQSGNSIKMIIKNIWRGEYTSLEFDKWCNDEGIEHILVAPYTPQHNGTAERRNMTVLNMITPYTP